MSSAIIIPRRTSIASARLGSFKHWIWNIIAIAFGYIYKYRCGKSYNIDIQREKNIDTDQRHAIWYDNEFTNYSAIFILRNKNLLYLDLTEIRGGGYKLEPIKCIRCFLYKPFVATLSISLQINMSFWPLNISVTKS